MNASQNPDKQHATLMTDRAFPQRRSCELFVQIAVVLRGLAIWRAGLWHLQQLATTSQILFSIAVSEESVVADTLEAIWENVEQEPTDELVGRKGHRFLLVFVAIVLPAE